MNLIVGASVCNVARALRHPVYDCFYVALAEGRGTKVVTTDDKLLRRTMGTRWAQFVRPLLPRVVRR